MRFYQEISLIPNDEIPPYEIWSKLYNQLHIALADLQNTLGHQPIGVSFPNYHYSERNQGGFATLGYKLRVFATSQADLEVLNLPKWLDRLDDYVHIRRIDSVDKDKVRGYVAVSRYRQPNINTQAKNLAKHKGISFDDALLHCQKYKRQAKCYPFIALKSQTNGHNYHLVIQQKQVDKPTQGTFNSYGINNASDAVTVPYW